MKAVKKPMIVDVRGPIGGPEFVDTPHGPVRAMTGDYIITAPSGDTWPIRAAIFALTYEVLTPGAPASDACPTPPAASEHQGGSR